MTFICRSALTKNSFGRSHRATFVRHVSAQASSPRKETDGESDGTPVRGRRSAMLLRDPGASSCRVADGTRTVHVETVARKRRIALIIQARLVVLKVFNC